jgi:hypothetical protein
VATPRIGAGISGDAAPILPNQNCANRSRRHAVETAEIALSCARAERLPNLTNLLLRQFDVASPPTIFRTCYGLQVLWIHARSFATQMIELKFFRNRSVGSNPSNSMRQPFAFVSCCASVTTTQFPLPNPAWGRITALFNAPKRVSPDLLRAASGMSWQIPVRLSFDRSARGVIHLGDGRRPAASALAQLRSKVLVHAASRVEVVNGGRGHRGLRLPHSIAEA